MARRRLAGRGLLVALLALVVLPAAAQAHPLGNLSSNSAAELVLTPEAVELIWVLDLAEIPAFQARQDMADQVVEDSSAPEAAAWADARCERAGDDLRVRLDGTVLDLEVDGIAELDFPPGEAGLTTLRLTCPFSATVTLEHGDIVDFEDASDLGRAGWREVIARGEGVDIGADVPTDSTTDQLLAYPEDTAPLRVTTASITIGGTDAASGAGEAPDDGLDPMTRAIEGFTSSLTELVAREDFTAPFALLAVVLSVALGAIHALAPGHGKTVMAAYLVSRRGTTRQAVGLGLTTAVTHTIGVLVLGTILSATQAFAPADLYPWLGLTSGMLFAVVGGVLLRRSILNRGHEHGTGPGQHTHDHHHHDHDHDHDHDDHEPDARGITTWRGMVLPGLAGGMVPSPSALVVLVGGIALGRAWFGVVLVAAYGIGMAATLVAAGYALTRARGWVEARAETSGRLAAAARALPAATAAVVVLGGLALTVRSLGVLL